MKSVSIVLPMFNEAGYVDKSVSKLISTLENFAADFEIIIVDDASTDDSGKIACAMAQKDRRIKVIRHEKNRKLGGSLRSGFKMASKEIVVYVDMDMPFDYSILKDVIPLVNECDIVTGYRLGPRESFKKVMYSYCYNLLVKVIFGLRVKDVNFSMKIFRKNILDSLNLQSEGSFISAEALIKAQYMGLKIVETPVFYTPRKLGRSRLSTFSVILKIIFEMIFLFRQIKAFKVLKKHAVNQR